MNKNTSCNIPPTTLAVFLTALVSLHVANTFNVNANEIPVRYDYMQLWRIHNISNAIHQQTEMALPELLEKKYGVNIWRDSSKYLDISIDKQNAAAAKSFLKEHNLMPELLNANVQELFDNEMIMGINMTQSKVGDRSKKASASGMNWRNYHDLQTIYDYLREIRNKFPKICTLFTIGKSAEGRNLMVLRISENPTNYKKIWIDGGIHAREWISPATVTFIINELLANWQLQPAYLKQKTWFIMPVMNPDGYVYSRKVNRQWRKNRSINKGSQCVGVDLNRNFNIGWGSAGSSANPCSELYRGASAASELETAAVVKFLKNHKQNLEAYLTYHSYSQVIVYPWAYKAATVYNAVELKRVGNLAATRIKNKTGKVYEVAITHQFFGVTGGGSDDWTRAALGTKYVYTIEMRDRGEYGFALPPNQILDAGAEGYTMAATVAQAISHNLIAST